MTGPLLYNPTRAGLDELDAMLVGRRPIVDKLVADLVADAAKPTPRHWQLVGPRGSGKSHLTQYVALRLAAEGWAVARLSEEQYRVNSLGDLLEQIVVRLEDTDESPLADVKAEDLEDRAIDRIRAWRKQHDRPVLVVVENLRLLFERKIRGQRDQARLRELLGRHAPFVLLATSTSLGEATTHHDAPFYDFFQTIQLDDLSVDEVAELILARARWDQAKALLEQADRLRARVRAMYHFSGGNPRLVMALYGVLRAGVTDELYQELLSLLDAVTPYYQARLQDVSPQSERVLAEMALAGKRLTPAGIARRCRMPTNQITALISKLEAERFIVPAGRPDGRSRYYDLTDRLFRIWMQMREDRTAGARLRSLAEFFQRWYGQAGVAAARETSAAAAVTATHARERGPAELLRWFATDATALLRAHPERLTEVVTLYERLRAEGRLATEVMPYAALCALRHEGATKAELSPEVREAVELAAGATDDGPGRVAGLTAASPGGTSRAAEARKPYGARGRGGRGKLRP